MKVSQDQQKKVLGALVALIVLLNGYYYLNSEKPKTAPLTYPRGAVAGSPMRQGALSAAGGADPLNIFLAQKEEKYPGASRDIFRMELPAPKRKLPPPSPVVTAPTPSIPEKTPEQIAEDQARADLSKFKFLGYLTEKDNTLFLSRDGELFMAKNGERVLNTYMIKEAGRDYVVLMDTVTHVNVRVELSGGEQPSQTGQPPPAWQPPSAWQPQPPQPQPPRYQ